MNENLIDIAVKMYLATHGIAFAIWVICILVFVVKVVQYAIENWRIQNQKWRTKK